MKCSIPQPEHGKRGAKSQTGSCLLRLRPFCGGDRRRSRTRIVECTPDRQVWLGVSRCFVPIGAFVQVVPKLFTSRRAAFRGPRRCREPECPSTIVAVLEPRGAGLDGRAGWMEKGTLLKLLLRLIASPSGGRPAGLVGGLDGQASVLGIRMSASCSVSSSLVRRRKLSRVWKDASSSLPCAISSHVPSPRDFRVISRALLRNTTLPS